MHFSLQPFALRLRNLIGTTLAIALTLLGYRVEGQHSPEHEEANAIEQSSQGCSDSLVSRRRAVSTPSKIEFDRFGVRKIYPTSPGGREWFLPSEADQPTSEWNPYTEPGKAMRIDDGVYQISGQVRMEVRSPAGKQWWRNFEMTGYIRYERYEASKDNLDPHWEWHGRGERHNALQLDGSKYNDSVAPPPGTITPPGYDHYKDQNPINSHCLGTAYHGNIYVPFGSSKARVVFEKEISHTGGYSDQRPCRLLRGFDPQPTGWFGYKFVTRNFDNNRKVRIEIWLDPQTTGNWILAATTDDTGGWRRSATMTLDGCDAGPFFFTDDQIMTWAAPWLVFRSDSVVWDFKWLSAREISALP